MYWRFFIAFLFLTVLTPNFAQETSHNHSIQHAFIENKGQWEKPILFKTHFSAGNLWVQQRKFVFHLQDYSNMQKNHGNPNDSGLEASMRQTVVHLNFSGSNEVTQIEKHHETTSYYNYFLGNNPSRWKENVKGYGEAILKEFYAGIDLKLIEEQEQLKYEFHVQPKANPSVIGFNYSGQKSVKIDKKGNLVVATDLGNIIEQKPYAYQVVNGKILEVPCDFELINGEVKFKLGKYNPAAILVIDPVLIFATYAGSVTDNFGMTATYGYDGTAYSGGTIYGNSYPTPDNSAFDVNSNFTVANNGNGLGYGITDVFISKYSADGTTMLWTSFLGGGNDQQGTETVHSLICDKFNNVYLYGATSSTDFPIVNAFQATHGGGAPNSNHYFNGVYFSNQGTDIYVAKLSSNGQNLLGSTYFGGSLNDGVNTKVSSGTYNSVASYDSLTSNYGDQFRGEIMLDSLGNCLVASCTRSTDFPVLNAFQPINNGMQDGVIFKLSSNLSTLQWSSYYGGSNNDACYSVKIDSSFNIVFAGGTSSSNLPNTAGGWQATFNGGKTDGFVAKLNSSGANILQASYVGTANSDQAFFVEIDRNDNVFLLGQSAGGNFPVVNAAFVNPNSSQFVLKLNPSLTTNLNSTVFGNGGSSVNISPAAFLVDICGNMYISGWGANILQGTPLSGMPVSPNAFIAAPPNGFDFYLLVIAREFTNLLYGSYLGGNQAQEHVDGGTSRFDKNGVVYQSVCGGCGGFSDFPTSSGAWSNSNLSTNCNNVLFKFDFQLIPNAEFTVDQSIGCATFNVVLENFSTASDSYLWDFGNGDTSSVIFNPAITYSIPGVYDISLYVTDSVCLLVDTAQITIIVTDSIQISLPATLELCSPTEITIIANSFGTADYFIWSTNAQFTDTLNTNISDSILTIVPNGSTTYYLQAGNLGCFSTDSVSVAFISSALELTANDSICLGDQTLITATNLNPSISFTYAWSPANVLVTPSGSNQVLVAPLETSYIFVTASASNGCVIVDSILISVSAIGEGLVNASASEILIPAGSATTLIGQPSGLSYQWSPTVGVTNPTMQTTSATVENTTIYTLSVSDGICTKTDTVLVKVFTFICGEPFIYIPNAFSPNGDKENDVLFVRGQLIEGMIFRVFDRWGEMVFESTDRNYGWDGTFRGKAMDPDVYDYYLKVICIDGIESIIKGNVTLLK
jgi:gliding motility-associated-like protein